MDQFTILYLLTFFCISYAPAQAGFREIRKIKEARIESYTMRARSRVFKGENVYLYRKVPQGESIAETWLAVGDFPKEYSEFTVSVDTTFVIKDSIIINYLSRTIKLIFDKNEDAFELYEEWFPLGELAPSFTVKSIFQGDEELDGVTSIGAEEYDPDEWLVVAFNGDKPRLIIPNKGYTLVSGENSDKKVVSVELRTKPAIKITVHFEDRAEGNRFYKFVKSPGVSGCYNFQTID